MNESGDYHHLFRALRRHSKKFFVCSRMSIDAFDYILTKVHDIIEKQYSWRRTKEEYSHPLTNASGNKLLCS